MASRIRLSAQFTSYMTYVHDLDYTVTPDYDYLQRLFDEVLEESSERDDGVYDWMLLDDGKGWDTVGFCYFLAGATI
jgi:casein kinase 1